MTGDLAATVANLLQTVRDGRGALLMDLDGVPVEQATRVADADPESLAGEYVGPLRQALALATELDLGALRTYSVRGMDRRVTFGFVRDDLVLGVEAGPMSLRAQMRHLVARTLDQLGDQYQ